MQGRAFTLKLGETIEIGDEHYVTVIEIATNGKDVRLFAAGPTHIRKKKPNSTHKESSREVIRDSKT